MKKEEAELIAKEKAKLMIEYLEQFMMDEDKISGSMNFGSENSKLVVDIAINKDGKRVFERGYNLGFSVAYADILTREISEHLIREFMPSDDFGVSEYAFIRDLPGRKRDGFYVFNSHNSIVNINFGVKNAEFDEIMQAHNNAIDEYRKSSSPLKR